MLKKKAKIQPNNDVLTAQVLPDFGEMGVSDGEFS